MTPEVHVNVYEITGTGESLWLHHPPAESDDDVVARVEKCRFLFLKI